MNLRIDPDFANNIPPLTAEEFQQLEENILADGVVINPIIVWNGVIVDGHNRYQIIQKHPEIGFTTHNKDFPDRNAVLAWICKNQLGRRNLTPEQRKYVIGKQYEAEKASRGGDRGNQYTVLASSQNGNLPKQNKTSERIAKENGVSKNTVLRAEQFAKKVDSVQNNVPEFRQEILSGVFSPSDQEINRIVEAPPDKQRQVIDEIKSEKMKKRERRPSAVIQNVLDISDKMVTPQSTATPDDVLCEMREALKSMKFRWDLSLEDYAVFFLDAECQQKLLALIQDGFDYLKEIEGGIYK